MHAILKEDPPGLVESNQGLPPALDHIVRHCLEKRPEQRFHSAHDIAFDLQTLSASAVVSGPAVAVGGRRLPRLLAAAGLVAAIVVTAVASYRLGSRAGERAAFAGLAFHQMSFRPQAIFQAAFAPDGETIVYSAALEGNQPELYTIRPEYPEPRPVGLPRTHLLAISSKGELAVLTNARFFIHRLFEGTLARMALGGTAPREILEGVRQADWSPDGSELAIIRSVGEKDRLEFPIGKVLYETAGYLSDLRVSARGDRIALFEHAQRFDDRGWVISVDRAGSRSVLSEEYWGAEGLAWSTSGDEILFTASTAGAAQTLYAVDRSGHRRVALKSPGGVTIHDVSRSGRWLVTRDDSVFQIMALAPGAGAEHDLSWLDLSGGPQLSPDGRLLLFTDYAEPAGANYAVCLRGTDGGPVVRLGEGTAWGLSPDGKWALALIQTQPPEIVIYPTGPGEARRLPRGALEGYNWGGWFPDGKHVLVCGHEPGKNSRCYQQDVSGGVPRPVTPEGTRRGKVSPDGQRVLVLGRAGTYEIYPMPGVTPAPVPVLSVQDLIAGWSTDGRSLFFFRRYEVPARLERLDLGSSRRELVRELAPADRAGVTNIEAITIADGGKSYAYAYDKLTSRLYVLEGAR